MSALCKRQTELTKNKNKTKNPNTSCEDWGLHLSINEIKVWIFLAQKDPSREKIRVDETVLQLKDESSLSLAIKSYTKGNNTCCDKIKEQ